MTPARSPQSRSPNKKSASTPAELPGLPLGNTGRVHPPIGLGLWSMGRWTHADEEKTQRTIDHALTHGVTWLDTAEVYGNGRSERLLGDALARHPGKRPFLTTKVSWNHLRRAQVHAAITGSLSRLGVPSVDVYLVHAPDPSVPIAETMESLELLWKEGKIGAIGVSNFSVPELVAAQRALREAPIVVNQVQYSLLSLADGDEVREYCRTNRIVLEAFTPLGRGVLAGRYLDGKSPPAEVRRFARDLFEVDRFPEVVEKGRAIRALAKAAGLPMASIALHWLRRQGAAPVFGASQPDQVDQILDAWSHVPADEVLEQADAIARTGP